MREVGAFSGFRASPGILIVFAMLTGGLWGFVFGAGADEENRLDTALAEARGVFLIDVEAINDVRPAEPFPNYWAEYSVVRGTGDERISMSLDPDGLAEGRHFWIVAGNTVDGFTELLWIAPADDELANARLGAIVEEDRFAWTPLYDAALNMSFGYRRGEEENRWLIRGFSDSEAKWTLTLELDEPMEVGGGMMVEPGSIITEHFLRALPDHVAGAVDTDRPVLYILSPARLRNGYIARGKNHYIDAKGGKLVGIADASRGPARGLELFDWESGLPLLEHEYEADSGGPGVDIRITTVYPAYTGEPAETIYSQAEYGFVEGSGYGWIYHLMDMSFDPNAFARDMVAAAGEGSDGENFVFSPFSIVTAFGMTYAGARSGTAAQMEEVFHFGDPEQTHAALADLSATVAGSVTGEDAVLRLANRIWLQRDWPVEDGFLQILDQYYEAPPEVADFRTQPEGERLGINQWVYDRTLERIEDLVPEGALDTYTRFVLVNALYFRALWEYPFDPEATMDAPFEVASGETMSVRMMYGQQGDVPYIDRDSAQAIALPVKDGDFSFVVVLPKPEASLDELRAAVAKDEFALDYDEWPRPNQVDVFIPRFRVEGEIDMKELLEGMGIVDAFNPHSADFTGIYTGPEPELHLTVARHKAFVEVIESGLEAAAATAAAGGVTSVSPQFRADRPFLFFITEDTTGTILFAGQVTHPEDPPESAAGGDEPDDYAEWLRKHFKNAQGSDLGIADPQAAPAGDGIKNLIKFFMGLDPHVPAAGLLPAPVIRVLEVDGTEDAYLIVRFTRPKNRLGVTHSVLLSDNLRDWVTQAVLDESIDNGDGTVTETWRDTIPARNSTARFARLEVLEETRN